MANKTQVALLRRGANEWNAWRTQNLRNLLDLRGAMLSDANLEYANLQGVDFTDGYFEETNLRGAILDDANLTHSTLVVANLTKASLARTNFSKVSLGDTMFTDVDLSTTRGLDTCKHWTGSIIDFRTLTRSGHLPPSFLRGVGLPDFIVDNFFKLERYYSCFISYSSKDQVIVNRLYNKLQNKGVRCWLAEHDLPIGAKILDAIDKAIRSRERLLLVLSQNSVASDWVEREVNTAFAEEQERNEQVLFPIRIDDAVFKANEPWARQLREQRHIGDLRKWRVHGVDQTGFDKLLHDLTKQGS